MSGPSDSPHFNKDNPFPARILENRLLTKPGSEKEIRHFVMDLTGSGLTYEPGDSLGAYPSNRPEEVEELIRLLGASGDEPVSPAMLKHTDPLPLREALFSRLALAGPTPRMVHTLAAKATDPAEQAKLKGLLEPEAKEVLTQFLAHREFVDLLHEFPSAKLTPQELVDHMRKLMPRLYSIASSPRLHPHHVHLTVAVIRYQTNQRDRVGVCTTFLSDRVNAGGSDVPVFVSHAHFGPPEDGSKDCIMVGPGTGIAPFRAFMQHRVAAGAPGRNWVFFGAQRQATDFLYEEEWDEWLRQGSLARLDLAWSRDQETKVYVQDKIRENAAELWTWIEGGAHFYVCGDAKRMAKDVDATLHEVIAEHGRMDSATADAYLKQMKKDRRYQRDVY